MCVEPGMMQWVDDDGDTITVSSNEEWLEALNAKADLSLTGELLGSLALAAHTLSVPTLKSKCFGR